MRKSVVAMLALSFALAACGSEQPAADPAQAVAAVEPVAVIDGAPTGPVYTEIAGDKLAVSGFDPVAYFQGEGKPVEGSADNVVLYQGYEYRFANRENAETFAADPAKYAPQYGGNCAWAASNGKLAPGNPQNYKVVDGKLYLNFNDTVQENWVKDIPGFISKADAEYPKFSPEQRYDDSDA